MKIVTSMMTKMMTLKSWIFNFFVPFAAPFAICPCEKHLVVNGICGMVLVSISFVARRFVKG